MKKAWAQPFGKTPSPISSVAQWATQLAYVANKDSGHPFPVSL